MRRHFQRPAHPDHPAGQVSVQRLAALLQIVRFRRSLRRPIVGGFLVGSQGALRDFLLEVQAVPQHQQLLVGHLLDLVGGVATLHVGSQGPSLDRLGEDDRGRALHLGGGRVGGVDLVVVEAAATEIAAAIREGNT